LKDADLDHIAEQGFNVARFVSASSNGEVRFARLVPGQDSRQHPFSTLVENLFAVGASAVNVRCFRPDTAQGNPFDYGIQNSASAIALATGHMAEGYFVIVNETIDVNDGGVSGVCEGGVWEFAPNATPRVVETGRVCRLPSALARRVIQSVYGSAPELDDSAGRRIEFSIHPVPVGYLKSRTLLWEISDSSARSLGGPVMWPNPFSRHLGDKTFGLVVADAIGISVPSTLAIPRNVPPFRFGTETGGSHTWTRTAPSSPKPGLFTTVKGWTDVFRLLANEDPEGTEIPCVLYQQGVEARHSGAAIPRDAPGQFLIEGVTGEGDRFMLGDVAPTPLPDAVISDVNAVLSRASQVLGPVRVEWVHDGQRAWVVQLHRATQTIEPGVFHPGIPENGWLVFTPADGLAALTDVIKQAKQQGRGVRVTGPVGLTSHVGDLIRRASVPAVVDWS
jgi:hypothetical protein